jgi:hypothetical protein
MKKEGTTLFIEIERTESARHRKSSIRQSNQQRALTFLEKARSDNEIRDLAKLFRGLIEEVTPQVSEHCTSFFFLAVL